MQLRDRVAVVTGGGSGIGRGLVLAMARASMHTLVADVDASAATAVAEEARTCGARSLGSAVDVRSYESAEALAECAYGEFGEVHLSCNNAGVMLTGPFDASEAADWSWVMGVNLLGVVHGPARVPPAHESPERRAPYREYRFGGRPPPRSEHAHLQRQQIRGCRPD